MKIIMMMNYLMTVSSLMLVLLGLASFPAANAQNPSLIGFPSGSNETHRTDVCERFLRYASAANFRDALEGLDLSVGVVDQLNNIYIRFNESGGISEESPGIFVVLLDELASRAGFTWRNNYARVLPPNLNQSDSENGTDWTVVLRNAVENYDFTFAEWAHSQERREQGISFPVGWYDASTILVQNQEDDTRKFDITAFLDPFSLLVWIMIVVVFFVSGILYWLIDKISNWGTGNEVNSVLYDIFLATMTFTQHHMYWDPSGHGKRIFAFSASFWSLVLASAYTANLASFLVSQGQPEVIATTVADVQANRIKLCIRRGAALETAIIDKYPRLRLIPQKDFAEMYERLLGGECKLIAARAYDFDQFRNNPKINSECSLQWVGRKDNDNKAGAATLVDTQTYCTSLITHVLDIHMHEMLDDGFIDSAWRNHIRNGTDFRCDDGFNDNDDEDGLKSLDISELGGIFIFHGIFGVLSVLVALVEQWWKRRGVRKLLEEASNEDGGNEAVIKMQKRASTSGKIPAMHHYQSSLGLQAITNERQEGSISRSSRSSGASHAGQLITSGDNLDFSEGVLETIQSLQSEMAKLQNYVVEKNNKQGKYAGA